MSTIRVNHAKNRIDISKEFAKKAEDVCSEEYALLQKARNDYKFYRVHTIPKKNESKESYKGLTYSYMERYIACHENAKEFRAEYDELRLCAECHSIRYPTIKKWFLLTYPEVKNFGSFDEEPEAKLEVLDTDNKKTA